ncbi:hypothetical protein DOO78_21140 [Roseicella frigidaeris]|uniref:Transglycosylase SLT domain-containing protein n=1 Tax=Roseicella frigidaeris TaxID=2230885 RepID=A0A327M273_9PROT|nr:hypothetical protein DOO78_21140 [Roseicella frigidaeris]
MALLVTGAAARAERPAQPAPSPPQLCRQAIQAAEREHQLPGGLLHAIGTVEAGRPDPAGKDLAAWPWTINAEGQGRYFDSKEEAVAAVEALRARGVKLIDVGCLQVNLYHHPQAFPDLQTAFDPMANARYAGLFLKRLYGQTKSWEQAAANYHSATPELGEAYRQLVMAAWPAMAAKLAEERRREALVAAWSNGKVIDAKPIGNNGFQVVAMANRQGAATARGAGQPLLLMGTPVLRPGTGKPPMTPTTRTVNGRRVMLMEVAELPAAAKSPR